MGIACIGSIMYSSRIFSYNNSDIDRYAYWEFYNLLQADSSKLYLENTASIFHTNAYGMWDVIPVGLSQNSYSLGNWLTSSPTTTEILKAYNIKNPFRDVIDNENIYLIDNYNIDMELSYIRRNYNDEAKAALVKNINGFMIYKIYTEMGASYGENLIEESKNIVSNIKIDYLPEEKRIDVCGNLYKKNINSYQQEFYIDIYNKDTKSHNLLPITQFQSEEEDLYNGKYGRIEQSITTEELEYGTYDIRILLHADQENYLAKKKEITLSDKPKE